MVTTAKKTAAPVRKSLAGAVMTALFVQIVIERDPMTKIPKLAAPWEVPVYRSQYGDEKVEILDDSVEVNISELPDAREEYVRLRDVFGIEADTKQSHVDLVYGRGPAGVKALEEAIQASIAGDIEAAQAVADGPGGVDDETSEKRDGMYRDPLDDAGLSFDHARAINDMGHRDPIGLAKVVTEAADAEAKARTEAEGARTHAIADAAATAATAAAVATAPAPTSTTSSAAAETAGDAAAKAEAAAKPAPKAK